MLKEKKYEYIALLVGFLIIFFLRLKFISTPFERDEGEYAYCGQLILQGYMPYDLAYNMKFPGTYFMNALFMFIFGENIYGIHFALLLINLGSFLFLYLICRNFLPKKISLISALSFGIFAISKSTRGFAGHATHFVSFFALFGFFLLILAIKEDNKKKYFFSALSLSLSFLMKQPGFFFCLFGFFVLFFNAFFEKKINKNFWINCLYFTTGLIVPFLLVFLVFIISGTFDKFYFWTFQYALKYSSQIPLSSAFLFFKERFYIVAKDFSLLWLTSFLGLIVLYFHPKIDKKTKIILFAFFVASFLTTTPGFYFRRHYFLTFIAAAAIFIGIFLDFLSILMQKKFSKKIVYSFIYSIFGLMLITGFAKNFDYFFKVKGKNIARFVYDLNPFPESLEIAKFIKENSKKDDKILVLGSEPQIYFYSDRHAATGYIYIYNLMENHKYALEMQKEMIEEIKASKPKFIVSVNISTSWLIKKNSETYILSWFKQFIKTNYRVVGIADMYNNQTVFKWRDELKGYKQGSKYGLFVLERIL